MTPKEQAKAWSKSLFDAALVRDRGAIQMPVKVGPKFRLEAGCVVAS
jgi:hypothetical protein